MPDSFPGQPNPDRRMPTFEPVDMSEINFGPIPTVHLEADKELGPDGKQRCVLRRGPNYDVIFKQLQMNDDGTITVDPDTHIVVLKLLHLPKSDPVQVKFLWIEKDGEAIVLKQVKQFVVVPDDPTLVRTKPTKPADKPARTLDDTGFAMLEPATGEGEEPVTYKFAAETAPEIPADCKGILIAADRIPENRREEFKWLIKPDLNEALLQAVKKIAKTAPDARETKLLQSAQFNNCTYPYIDRVCQIFTEVHRDLKVTVFEALKTPTKVQNTLSPFLDFLKLISN